MSGTHRSLDGAQLRPGMEAQPPRDGLPGRLKEQHVKKLLLGTLAATALVAPLALSTGSANAAPAAPKLNHGQCVSGSVHAGVTGAAHEAIAQDNSLVGEYGTATCPLVVPVAPPKA